MSQSVSIQSLAAASGGVVSVRQAVSAGILRQAVEHEVAVGRLLAMHPGVYRSAGTPPSHRLDVLAAVTAAGPAAVVSHRSAACLHGLPAGSVDVVEITVPHHLRPRLRGVDVHRSLRLPDSHRRRIDGLPVTSVERTLADIGAVVRTEAVRRSAETAVVRRLTTVERLLGFVDDNGQRGRTGIGALRSVLEDWLLSERPPDSELEIAFGRLVNRLGLPAPRYQFEVIDDHGRFVARLDAGWPEHRLAVEIDGFSAHGSPSSMQRDLTRQNRLVALGWTVLRFTWHDVVRRPDHVAGQIATLLTVLGTSS